MASYINFYTGGYAGEGLANIQTFIASKKWWFHPSRNEDGSINFLIGAFLKDSDGAKEMEIFLKEHKYWYQVREEKKNMKISRNGINLIKKFEGVRLTAYKAVASERYYTIGYGHYGSDVKAGQKITQAKADQLFMNDIKRFEDGVNKAVEVPLSQNQFDACVSLAYNIGVGGFQKSSVVAYLNKGNYGMAANAFGSYTHAGGKVLQGLVSRRKQEKDLFLNGKMIVGAEESAGGGTVESSSSLGSKVSKIVQSPIVWGVVFTSLLFRS